MIASLEGNIPIRGLNVNDHNWKGNNNKSGVTSVWCCGITVDGGRCGASAAGWDRKYGIRPVGGYWAVGGRVCNRHQNIFDLMSYLNFSLL